MPDELDAIRIRLDARSTPGEWHTNEPGPYVHSVWSDNGPVRDFVATGVGPSDARFIAHAPTDIANLLAHVDRLRDLCESHGIDPDGCEVCFLRDTAHLPGHVLVSTEEIAALRERAAALEAELAEATEHLAGKKP